MSTAKTPTLPLTPRELEVLKLMANGYHNNQMAPLLGISEHTAKFHVNSILTKTGYYTRLGAVIFCLKKGIIHLDSLMSDVPMTATALAIIEENKQAMEVQKQNMKENILSDIMESVDKLSMDFGNEQLSVEIKETLNTYFP